MFMLIKEDIEKLLVACEKTIYTNIIKEKKYKKEERTLKKVIDNYEVNEDNSIIYNEIVNRYNNIGDSLHLLKEENKYLKGAVKKLNSILNTDNVIEEEAQTEDNTDNIVYEVE